MQQFCFRFVSLLHIENCSKRQIVHGREENQHNIVGDLRKCNCELKLARAQVLELIDNPTRRVISHSFLPFHYNVWQHFKRLGCLRSTILLPQFNSEISRRRGKKSFIENEILSWMLKFYVSLLHCLIECNLWGWQRWSGFVWLGAVCVYAWEKTRLSPWEKWSPKQAETLVVLIEKFDSIMLIIILKPLYMTP